MNHVGLRSGQIYRALRIITCRFRMVKCTVKKEKGGAHSSEKIEWLKERRVRGRKGGLGS